ncbi:TIGR03943 family putative permease subunit [Bacillus sp. UMB0893]|uniref:TIGR03943 family putative permease subunit n=1 Tax=Bacillus sp. UMB0893 TaxID=2066053 RepID=UPI000C77D5CB|nr:TIGR03943 family protein [Bacillus sp. UMB0893]PLR69665.1 TIGR03943 family protein [Bacillus sp. UMB0893]QNG58863.1 TIGR03943 family protein [Bacillus sp. PAMC26568]
MFRLFLLMAFTYFFFHLHASGNITNYINMKYSYLSYSAIFIFALLTIIQAYTYFKTPEDDHCDSNCCHPHEKRSGIKKFVLYAIFIYPLIAGFFFPIAKLDSNIVKAKGFTFQNLDSGDYSRNQYLRPDTSVYYGKEGYYDLMQEELEKYASMSSLHLSADNYLKGMETIYQFPGEFLDKTIQFDGFAFKGESINKNQLFVLRFGIIHCIADSGVYGMLVEFPEEVKLKDDEWIHVKGTLSSIYYQPFKAKIPYVKAESWKKIKAPEDPYVYRRY